MTANYFVGWIFAWGLFWAVGAGVISEGAVASMKFASPKWILLAAPPVVGALFYLCMASFAAATLLGRVMKSILVNTWPELGRLGLIEVTLLPTITNIERFLANNLVGAGRISKVNLVWLTAVILTFGIASLMSQLQMIWFAVALYPGSLWAAVGSVIMGVVLWVRGFFVSVTVLAL
jgi:hypothetical protein